MKPLRDKLKIYREEKVVHGTLRDHQRHLSLSLEDVVSPGMSQREVQKEIVIDANKLESKSSYIRRAIYYTKQWSDFEEEETEEACQDEEEEVDDDELTPCSHANKQKEEDDRSRIFPEVKHRVEKISKVRDVNIPVSADCLSARASL